MLVFMKRLRKYQIDLVVILGFLLLPLLLFGNVTLGNQTMLPADNLFQWEPWTSAAENFDTITPQNGLLTDLIVENYAWKRFALSSIKEGDIPLWNPYLFAGAPFLATGQHSTYYPFSLLFWILPLAKAYGWYTVSQLWLAGVLMYVYGRALKMRRSSAMLAGLVYQGSGFMLTSAAVFPMIIGAAAWLPLLLACVEKVVQTSINPDRRRSTTLLWVILGAVALGIQTLAGHIEITYYTLLLMALFALWRLISLFFLPSNSSSFSTQHSSFSSRFKPLLRPSAWLLSMVLLGLLLSSIQLIPFYEVGQVNFREGSASLAEVRSWAFPKRRILTLLLPNFYGNPAHQSYVDTFSGEMVALPGTSHWGIKNYVEGGIYLGVLSLFLAFLGLFAALRRSSEKLRKWHAWFFIILSFFSLAFIFGTPLYALLYYGLPFINQLHTPFRWVFPLSLCVRCWLDLALIT